MRGKIENPAYSAGFFFNCNTITKPEHACPYKDRLDAAHSWLRSGTTLRETFVHSIHNRSLPWIRELNGLNNITFFCQIDIYYYSDIFIISLFHRIIFAISAQASASARA